MLIFLPHHLIWAVNLIFRGRTLKWWTKFARLMRLFVINVAECNLKPSLEHLGFRKLLVAHTVSYILP